ATDPRHAWRRCWSVRRTPPSRDHGAYIPARPATRLRSVPIGPAGIVTLGGLVSRNAWAFTVRQEVRTMSRLAAVVFGAALLVSGSALAACVSVGSQLDCRWPGIAMRLGTQTDPHAQDSGLALRTEGFAGPVTLGRPLPARDTLVFSVQSFSNDP